MNGLHYIGGGAHIPAWYDGRSVPARDLTADEVKSFGKEKLLATGLYVESDGQTTKRKEQNT